MITDAKFEFVRGDTYQRSFSISGFDSEITNIYFTVKKGENDKDYILQKTLNNGIAQLDENSKTYRLTIDATDTDDFETNQEYPFDIEIMSNTYKRTIITGSMILTSDITRTFNE